MSALRAALERASPAEIGEALRALLPALPPGAADVTTQEILAAVRAATRERTVRAARRGARLPRGTVRVG